MCVCGGCVNPALFDVSEVTGHKTYLTSQALTHVGRQMVDLSFAVRVRPSRTTGQLGTLTAVLDPFGGEAVHVAARMGEEC